MKFIVFSSIQFQTRTRGRVDKKSKKRLDIINRSPYVSLLLWTQIYEALEKKSLIIAEHCTTYSVRDAQRVKTD